MFISKKELLKRIISLEEALGLRYVRSDGQEYDFSEHVVGDYGFIKNTKEFIKELEKTNGKK